MRTHRTRVVAEAISPTSTFRIRTAALSAAAVVSLVLSGCAGVDVPPANSNGPQEITKIRVMDTQGTSASFIEYAISEGIFAKHGLEVDFQPAAGGAASVPALISGDIQFAGSGVTSIIAAAAKGLPLRYVAPGVVSTSEKDKHSSTVFAAEGSSIKSINDLKGKKIAVCTLRSMCDLPIRVALVKAGMSPEDVQFVEIPFPDTMTAIQRGAVDAGFLIEPFETNALKADLVPVIYPYEEIRSALQISAYATTEQYAQDNPGIVESFRGALADTADAINADLSKFRGFMVAYTKVPAEIAGDISLPVWRAEDDPSSWVELSDQMLKFGYIEKAPDLTKLGVVK